jgi:hypothetical protein
MPEAKPMPVTFTLALYTQAGVWAPTGVARRLEEMARIGTSVGVIAFDVFGVGRGGESVEWNAWANKWLTTLLSRASNALTPWPATERPVVPPPVEPPVTPPVVPTEPRSRRKQVSLWTQLVAAFKRLFGMR